MVNNNKFEYENWLIAPKFSVFARGDQKYNKFEGRGRKIPLDNGGGSQSGLHRDAEIHGSRRLMPHPMVGDGQIAESAGMEMDLSYGPELRDKVSTVGFAPTNCGVNNSTKERLAESEVMPALILQDINRVIGG